MKGECLLLPLLLTIVLVVLARAMKTKKRHPDWKQKSKTMSAYKRYDPLHKKSQGTCTRNVRELKSKFSN